MAAPDDTAPDPSLDGVGYAEAVAELEEILEQLDGDEIDVDHLAAQVRRAAELIALCRSRLSAARMEVTRIVADLDAASAVPGADDGNRPATEADVGDADTDGSGGPDPDSDADDPDDHDTDGPGRDAT